MNKMFIVTLALIAVLIISGCTTGSNQQSDNMHKNDANSFGADVEWRCSNTQCAEFLNGQDWAKANCIQNGDKIVCPVVSNGKQVLVPIEQINISAVRSCAKFVCTEEMPVRKVKEPYEINLTLQR